MQLKFAALLAMLFLVTACSNKSNNDKEGIAQSDTTRENVDEPVDAKDSKKKVTDRDFSITPENAFNNIFLDSMAMEKYISRRQLSDKKIARRIRSFYNARNYQYAWFSSAGLSEQARFFWNQYDYAVTHLNDSSLANNSFYRQADSYINQEKVAVRTNDSVLLNTEFGFTEQFIRFINSAYEEGYVKRKEQEKFIPIKKMDPLLMADSLLNKKHKDDKYYEDVNSMYADLKKELALYYNIARSGGWSEIPAVPAGLKKGGSHASVPFVKKRLQLVKLMPGADTSEVFTDTLELAVKKFQKSLGYKETGILSKAQVTDLNVPAEKRVAQILLNMDRMRWMPQKPSGHLIIVNIPEFILHVYNGKETVFDMVVVVGKVGNNTMMFNGELSQVIFSPYWNIPPSIVQKEILPGISKNPNYLSRKNMEKAGNGYRQKPGPGNALGKVKFIFPNNFNIYFHDTPSKSLFGEDKRAFSHGCIRLSEPQKMAEWLLRDDSQWNREKIVAAMNRTTETGVKLKQSVPVFIIYYTAWVDPSGLLHFRDDVYRHDEVVSKKMFVPAQPPAKIIRVDNIKVGK